MQTTILGAGFTLGVLIIHLFPVTYFSDSSESKSAGNKAGGKPDWYTVLGVEKTASQSDIKKVSLSVSYQPAPDSFRLIINLRRNGTPIKQTTKYPSLLFLLPISHLLQQNPTARKKFNEVAEAYATLSDPKRKEIYDKYGHSEQADMAHVLPPSFLFLRPSFQFDPEEMFAELFGNFDPFEPGANQQNKNNQTGANIDIPVKLTFHEAAHGTWS